MLSGLVELLGSCPSEDLGSLFTALVAAATLVRGDRGLGALAKDLGMGVSGRGSLVVVGTGSCRWGTQWGVLSFSNLNLVVLRSRVGSYNTRMSMANIFLAAISQFFVPRGAHCPQHH